MNDNYNHENNNNNKNNNNLFSSRKKVIFGFFLSFFLVPAECWPEKENSGLSRVPPKKIGHGNVGTEISVEN